MYFECYNRSHIQSLISIRDGETKLGSCVEVISNVQLWEKELETSEAKYVLLGIPEDFGVRANYGKSGANTSWKTFLQSFLNIQSTTSCTGKNLLILGAFNFESEYLSSNNLSITELRNLVEQIDELVFNVVSKIFKLGKIPIVIGGGHNNCYPLIKAASLTYNKPINCINLDAHSDFRALEGRHSGNGFSYAFHNKYLSKYAILGLHKSYNSQNVMDEIHANPNIKYFYFEDIFIENSISFKAATSDLLNHVCENNAFVGIELDVDSIANVASSAITPIGISSIEALQYINTCKKNISDVAYWHIPEAISYSESVGNSTTTGKLLSYFVSIIIRL
jgi:formiminoglutamase